jgi:hypothetical protein
MTVGKIRQRIEAEAPVSDSNGEFPHNDAAPLESGSVEQRVTEWRASVSEPAQFRSMC